MGRLRRQVSDRLVPIATGDGVPISGDNPIPIAGEITAVAEFDAAKGEGASDGTTLRTVAASDSPEAVASAAMQLLLDLLAAAAVDKGEVTPDKVIQVGGWCFNNDLKMRAIEIDVGNGVVTIDSGHHEIHEGNSWTAAESHVTSGTTPRVYLIKVGTADCHLEIGLNTSLGVVASLYEGPTFTVDGTPIVEKNRNRAHYDTTLSYTKVYHTPTTQADGTLLTTTRLGGGSTSARVGGAGTSRGEWVLKPNTNYLLRVTPDQSTTSIVTEFNWYGGHDHVTGLHEDGYIPNP